MRKLFLAFSLMVISSVFAFAQTTSDYKKGEFYVGYSNNQVDLGTDSGNDVRNFFRDRLSFNGFEVSGVANVSRYVGIKGDVSGAYRSKNFTGVSVPVTVGSTTTNVNVNFDTKNSLYNFLGGVQFKDNANTGRVKPFGHVLAGAGHARTKVSNVTCTSTGTTTCSASVFSNSTESETGFAMAFGGGLDIRVSNHVDIRAIQVDYNPIRLAGSFDHNFRFGVGLNFK